MTWRYCAATLPLLLAFALSARADLHLGMKLACKRYGDAFKAGNKRDLLSESSPDFARLWNRVPPEIFSKLPRSGSGALLNSQKTATGGTVTVATNQGQITFVLVGGGFSWKVDDILKPNDDGTRISLKDYLDATLTVREFMNKLKYVGGTSFDNSISLALRFAFHDLTAEQLHHVRRFLPDASSSQPPQVRIRQDRATVCIRMPNGTSDDTITFHLRKEGGWRVDDYVVKSTTVSIPSFRVALPIIASMAGFNEFVRSKGLTDARCFTTSGDLREALEFASTEDPFPLKIADNRREFRISQDGKTVFVRYADRSIQLTLDCENGRQGLLSRVQLKSGADWSDVATMLAMKRKLKDLSIASAFASWTSRGTDSKPATEPQQPLKVARSAASSDSKPLAESNLQNVTEVEEQTASAIPHQSSSNDAAIRSHGSPEILIARPVIHPVTYREYRRTYRRMIRVQRRCGF